MKALAAALLAAGFAFVLNRWSIKRFGLAEVIWIGPLGEELLKTGIAIIWGTDIVPVHVFFGMLEALSDMRAGTPHRYAAALASVVGHGAFGYATMWGYMNHASLWRGFLIGIAAHVAWNCCVLIFLARKSRGKEEP